MQLFWYSRPIGVCRRQHSINGDKHCQWKPQIFDPPPLSRSPKLCHRWLRQRANHWATSPPSPYTVANLRGYCPGQYVPCGLGGTFSICFLFSFPFNFSPYLYVTFRIGPLRFQAGCRRRELNLVFNLAWMWNGGILFFYRSLFCFLSPPNVRGGPIGINLYSSVGRI